MEEDRRDPAVAVEACAPVRTGDPRRRILHALVRTVAIRGYERTTIDEVLALADVPAPVFAEHFEDKQDCLLAALDSLIDQIGRSMVEWVVGARSWSERVRLGLQGLLSTLARHPDWARVTFVECLAAGEPAAARVHRALACFVPPVEQGRVSREAGDTAHLPQQTAEGIVGGIATIVHRRILEGQTSQLPALLPDLLYFALMPYLGHRRALAAAARV